MLMWTALAGCAWTPIDRYGEARVAAEGLRLSAVDLPTSFTTCGDVLVRLAVSPQVSDGSVDVQILVDQQPSTAVLLPTDADGAFTVALPNTLWSRASHEVAIEVSSNGWLESVDLESLEDATPLGFLDSDGDGFAGLVLAPDCAGSGLAEGEDCDDTDSSIFPGAVEVPSDTIDQDCDTLDLCFVDDDQDGFGSAAIPAVNCGVVGLAVGGGDCDDARSWVNPAALEVCDGVDTDCDQETGTNEVDADGDGYLVCMGFVDRGLQWVGGNDCHDDLPTLYPGVAEFCDGYPDSNCDGVLLDEEVDHDQDGRLICISEGALAPGIEGGEDCADDDASVYPDAPELCDGVSSNCEPLSHEESDQDGDHHLVCVAEPGSGWLGGDCDDGDPNRNPGMSERCDGVDNDCDAVIPVDERDDDVDGYLSCIGSFFDASLGLLGNGDCDPTAHDVHPLADEGCNGVDNDCDGHLGVEEVQDVDEDGFVVCEDCNDGVSAVHPGALELCDGIDHNCDGLDTDGEDQDGDGSPICVDCNDDDPAMYPGNVEVCDGVLNTCDPLGVPDLGARFRALPLGGAAADFDFLFQALAHLPNGGELHVCEDSVGSAVMHFDNGGAVSVIGHSIAGERPQLVLSANLSGADVSFEGLTLAPRQNSFFGAIQRFSATGETRLTDVEIICSGNELSPQYGGAISTSRPLVLENTSIDGCTATHQGGALHSSSDVVVRGGAFVNNTSAAGGAFFVGGSLTVEGTPVHPVLFDGNDGGDRGGALTLFGDSHVLNWVDLRNNTAENGGGFFFGDGAGHTSHLTVEDNTGGGGSLTGSGWTFDHLIVSNNTRSGTGGGMRVVGDNNDIRGTFVGNTGGTGGALHITGTGNVFRVEVEGNAASDSDGVGGAVVEAAASGTRFDDSSFHGNTGADTRNLLVEAETTLESTQLMGGPGSSSRNIRLLALTVAQESEFHQDDLDNAWARFNGAGSLVCSDCALATDVRVQFTGGDLNVTAGSLADFTCSQALMDCVDTSH